MELKLKQYTLSPQDKLPKEISDPEELIQKITKKIAINSTASNINSCFPWINLAEQTLKRYSNYNEALIINLQYNLAALLIDHSDYTRAKGLLEKTIKKYLIQNKPNKKKLANCYWYLAMTLRYLEDYDNAGVNIKKAIDLIEDNYSYHLEYADILFKSGEIEEAENYYKKSLKICIHKNGKEHLETASIYSAYGNFLLYSGRFDKKDKTKKYLYDAYLLFKKNNGEETLYTARTLAHFSIFLFAMERQYSEAFENMKNVYSNIKNIFGDDHIETLNCKSHCAMMLVKMKQFSKAIDYLKNPFVVISKEEQMVLLAYDNKIMTAAEVILYKTGSGASKTLKIMEEKNVPIVKNTALVKGLINDSVPFEPIPYKYWKPVVIILTKLYKEGRIVLK